MSKRSRILTFGLPAIGAAALIGGTTLVIINRPVARAEDPPRQPTTAPLPAQGQDPAMYIGAIGVSEPPGEAIALSAHIPGVVTDVPVTVGDRVEANAALLQIDDRQARSLLAQRQADVEVAKAQVESLKAQAGPRQAAVESAQAAVASAQADVTAAKADRDDRANQLRVVEALTDPRAVASEEKDQRRFAAQQAEARLATSQAKVAEAQAKVAQAKAQLALIRDPQTGKPGPEVQATLQRVAELQAKADQAQVDLDLLTLRVPFPARVLQINTRPGEYAPASDEGDGLIVLGRTGPIHLRVEIDEVDIPRYSRDATAWASPRGQAEQRIALTLAYVEPLVVPKTNLSSRTTDRIDTRVLQAVYRLGDKTTDSALGIGQQFDVYIQARPAN